MGAVFVTGTGTDIGKTFVTAGLVRHLRALGRDVAALKPVVSGFDPARPDGSDPAQLLTALDRPVTAAEIARIAPWRFAAPLSPDMAAAHEGRGLDFDALVRFSQEAAGAVRDMLLIEGVGGVLVPLDAHNTVLDWMVRLRIPVLLVAGSYLGTISHTLTALRALQQSDLAVMAIAISETAGSTVSLADTAASIARFAVPLEVVAIPRGADADHAAFARLAAMV